MSASPSRSHTDTPGEPPFEHPEQRRSRLIQTIHDLRADKAALLADLQRTEEDRNGWRALCRGLHAAVSESQAKDNTGGDSAVAATLVAYDEYMAVQADV